MWTSPNINIIVLVMVFLMVKVMPSNVSGLSLNGKKICVHNVYQNIYVSGHDSD